MQRFTNELKVPERIYRARLKTLRRLQELNSPRHVVADAAFTVIQSVKPAPFHVKVRTWLEDHLPQWMKYWIFNEK
jgi:hypothetical protein